MGLSLKERLLEEEEFSIDKAFIRIGFYAHFLIYVLFYLLSARWNAYVIATILLLSVIMLLGFWIPGNRMYLNSYILGSTFWIIFSINIIYFFRETADKNYYHQSLYYLVSCILIVIQAVRFNRYAIINVFIFTSVLFTIFHISYMVHKLIPIDITRSAISYLLFLSSTVVGQLLYEAKVKAFHSYIRVYEEKFDVDKELLLARNVQESLFPGPLQTDNMRYIAFRKTHKHIGGDFYDFVQLREGNLGIFLTDVAGHGISSALIAAIIKVMVSNIPYIYKLDPPSLLTYLDERLSNEFASYHATALYLYLNFIDNTVSIANAGHPYVIYSRKGEPFVEIKTVGTIIGFKMRNPVADQVMIELHKGDRFFIYTDGIIECTNQEDEMLGSHNLLELLNQFRDKEIDEIKPKLLTELAKYRGGQDFDDDAMFLIFEIT